MISASDAKLLRAGAKKFGLPYKQLKNSFNKLTVEEKVQFRLETQALFQKKDKNGK